MNKDFILAVAYDAGLDFIAYDRKNCEDLPVGKIEELVHKDEVSLAEISDAFYHGVLENGNFEGGRFNNGR